jgi:hypothetical protein
LLQQDKRKCMVRCEMDCAKVFLRRESDLSTKLWTRSAQRAMLNQDLWQQPNRIQTSYSWPSLTFCISAITPSHAVFRGLKKDRSSKEIFLMTKIGAHLMAKILWNCFPPFKVLHLVLSPLNQEKWHFFITDNSRL